MKISYLIGMVTLVLVIVGYSEYTYQNEDAQHGVTENKPAKEENKTLKRVSEKIVNKAYASSELQDDNKIDIMKVKDKKTIALLGSDTRIDDGDGRSDAIIVLQLDPDNKKISYVSLPRDSYVDIVGKDYKDKINHAMMYGVDYTINTLENLLKVKIDNYFMIDFNSFERIVDTLGGVEVDVEFGFTEQNREGKRNAITIKEGLQTLTGEEALAYARMRKQDAEGDLGRAKRQQQIVESVYNKAMEMSVIDKLNLSKVVLSEVDTNIGLKHITDYFSYIKQYETVEKLVITGNGMKIDGVYYLDLNKDQLMKAINTLQGNSDVDKNGTYTGQKENKYDY